MGEDRTLIERISELREEMQLKESTYRRYIYEFHILERIGGSPRLSDWSQDAHDSWRILAQRSGLSTRTIESILSSVRTVCRESGIVIHPGRMLRHRHVLKYTPSFDDFCKVIDHCRAYAGKTREWWTAWMLFAYTTGMRCGDLLSVTSERISGGMVSFVASKTGKTQTIPLPYRLIEMMQSIGCTSLRVGRKQLRYALRVFCGAASTQVFTPQAIRRLSAKEWERAHAGCGAVILGHAIPGWSNATKSYLDGSDLLRMGIGRLRLPRQIADKDREAREKEICLLAKSLDDVEQTAAVTVLRSMGRAS